MRVGFKFGGRLAWRRVSKASIPFPKMGKPKKKGRANKKKRGGGAGGPPNSRGANAGEVNGVFRGDVPSFTFGESEGGRGRPIRTLYSSYKRATDRFLRYMLNNVPGT